MAVRTGTGAGVGPVVGLGPGLVGGQWGREGRSGRASVAPYTMRISRSSAHFATPVGRPLSPPCLASATSTGPRGATAATAARAAVAVMVAAAAAVAAAAVGRTMARKVGAGAGAGMVLGVGVGVGLGAAAVSGLRLGQRRRGGCKTSRTSDSTSATQ